jgi:hypothetical protein
MIPNGPDNPGINGPLIQAEVGDRILVHFQNSTRCSTGRTRCTSTARALPPGLRRRYLPGFSGPERT